MAKKPSALSKLNDYNPATQAGSIQEPAPTPSAPASKAKPRKTKQQSAHASPLNKINPSITKDPIIIQSQTQPTPAVIAPATIESRPAEPLQPEHPALNGEQTPPHSQKKFPKSNKKQRTNRVDPVMTPAENQQRPEEDPDLVDHPNEPEAPTESGTVDYEKLEYQLDLDEELRAQKERRAAERSVVAHKIGTVFMVLACVYLIFLIYGALNTSYVYNDDGKVIAQKMSVKQIQDLRDFETIANEYRQARTVYEAALQLDYRIAAGIEDPLLIAPEYERLLEQIEALAIQCQAISVSTQYTQLQTMLNIWITTDIAVYCQNMSAAISRNDASAAERALEYRTMAYNDFSVITANIATMGAQVDGADITDITEWSPEKYINQQIGGIGGELG